MNLDYYKKLQNEYIYFIFGILSTIGLLNFMLFFNERFLIVLDPDLYVLAIPIIFGLIIQVFFRNLLSDTIVPQHYFEKGILFHFFINLFIYVIFPSLTEKINNNEIGFLFVLYQSPLITYCFLSWIYYYIQSIRYQYYQKIYLNLNMKTIINNITVDENEDTTEPKNILNHYETVSNKISKKIEDYIKK